jgi:hypothetical protein
VTLTFADSTTGVLLVKVKAYTSGNRWQLILTHYPGKEVNAISVAPLTAGSLIPLIVVQ